MNSYRKYGIALLAGALLVAGWAGNALALTDACTPISNQASLTYSVGGIPQPTPVLSDDPNVAGNQATDFLVATKVDLTVGIAGPIVSATGADNVMTFRVINTGNDQQRYSLRLWGAANGYDYDGTTAYVDNFDMNSIRVYTDNDNNFGNGTTATISANATADGSHLGYTANIAGNNGEVYVHVVANVPGGALNGDDAIYALQAVTHQIVGRQGGNNAAAASDGGETDESVETANGCSSAVVLADNQVTGTGGGGAGPGGVTDTARNGDSFAVGVYTVSTATISMAKTYTVIWDPINLAVSPKAIPGARVQYTMTITNSSTTTAASSLELIDAIPTNTDYYVTTPASEDTTTGIIAFSNNNQATYAYSPTGGANGADPAVTHVRVQIPSLPFDDGAGPNDNTAAVTFIVVIE